MKRNNKVVRAASVLFALALITTSGVSGTFAKYVTSGSANDNARVAKFGVVINTSGSLFSDAYIEQLEKNGNIPVVWNSQFKNDNNSFTVATSGGTEGNIVAPGTQSDQGLTFGISGKPEVATQISATIKARDIYLKSGYTYAVMTPIDTVTAENYTKLVEEYAKDTSTNKLYWKETGSTEYALQHTGDNATAFATNTNGKYYVMSNEVALTSDYYPVQYTLTGSKDYTPSLNTSSTEAIAEALIGQMVTYDEKENSTKFTTPTVSKQSIKDTYNTKTDNGLTTYTLDKDYIKTYDPNTDLSATAGASLGNEKLTWAWDFDANKVGTYDKEDTILSDMIAYNSNSPTYYVVAGTSGTSVSYSDVTYADNNLVKAGNDEVASLQTSFEIELTVTQVD
jgi:hypothetical protein